MDTENNKNIGIKDEHDRGEKDGHLVSFLFNI